MEFKFSQVQFYFFRAILFKSFIIMFLVTGQLLTILCSTDMCKLIRTIAFIHLISNNQKTFSSRIICTAAPERTVLSRVKNVKHIFSCKHETAQHNKSQYINYIYIINDFNYLLMKLTWLAKHLSSESLSVSCVCG